jgi:hypothetical protein
MVRQLGVASSNLLVQQRRLAEHNLSVEATARLVYRYADLARIEPTEIPTTVSEGFIVMELSLTNIGDSPVDILACMAAGRELMNANEEGVYLGVAGRDVRWQELPSYYWWDPAEIAPQSKAESPGQQLFRGLSTTKNLPYSRYQLIRLDPGEGEILTRIDYVTDLERFYRQGHVNLIYKLFTVTLGYPLAEISRQIGAGAQGPTTPPENARRNNQDVGRPN